MRSVRGNGLIDLMDNGNVGVAQRSRGASLPVEASTIVLIRQSVWRQDFDGHRAVQLGVLGLVHDAHAAAAKLG